MRMSLNPVRRILKERKGPLSQYHHLSQCYRFHRYVLRHMMATSTLMVNFCNTMVNMVMKCGMKLDEEKDSEASYKSIGGHFGYEPLGVPEDEEQEAAWHEYRDAPGPVGERRWERAIKWKQPATEVVSCWWATNMTACDQSEEAKFLCRSVATLRVILGDLRALRLSVLPCLS